MGRRPFDRQRLAVQAGLVFVQVLAIKGMDRGPLLDHERQGLGVDRDIDVVAQRAGGKEPRRHRVRGRGEHAALERDPFRLDAGCQQKEGAAVGKLESGG